MRIRALSLLVAILLPLSVGAEPRCGKSATMSEARELALKAAEHLAQVGAVKAFNDFVDPHGPYLRDDLYVFVFDRDGKMLLNVAFPELIGSTVFGDPTMGGGWPAARDAMRLTENGGSGWIAYDWINPCTGSRGPKRSYVVGVGELIVGVGAYGELEAV